jgi:5-methylcytosine-specific restriction endonuclease McrA
MSKEFVEVLDGAFTWLGYMMAAILLYRVVDGGTPLEWENGVDRVAVIATLCLFALSIICKRVARSMPSSSYNRRYSSMSQYPSNWGDIREEVLARDGHHCGNCGSTSNLHVHHIVPLSLGGSNELGNLRTLCETCHKKLHPHMRG